MLDVDKQLDKRAMVALRLCILSRLDGIRALYAATDQQRKQKVADVKHLCAELGVLDALTHMGETFDAPDGLDELVTAVRTSLPE